MAYYVDQNGQLVSSEDDPGELTRAGYRPATQQDKDAHNAAVDYEEKGVLGKAGELATAGFKSAARTVEQGLTAVGLDTGYQRDENGNPRDPAAATGTLYSDADRIQAEQHPIAGAAGQAFVGAPLAFAGGLPGLALEASLGGTAAEAENAWQQDREFSAESAFLNVGAGLLVGGGLMAGAKGLSKLGGYGRNLLTEAEHAAAAREGRELLDKAQVATRAESMTADDIARSGADDAGVAYLRDNADGLIDQLSTKQAKAAQELVDTYDELAALRPNPDEIADAIPADKGLDQARWVSAARAEVDDAIRDLPESIAAPLRDRLDSLTDGDDAAQWFVRSSELSDELVRARAQAVREAVDAAPEPAPAGASGVLDDAQVVTLEGRAVEALDAAKRVIDDGLADQRLWGGAAKAEAQRAAGYARRYGDHLEAFQGGFMSKVGGELRADPAKFRTFLTQDDVARALRSDTFRQTLDSARATADAAARFGRKPEAERILAAIDTLERTSGQASAVQRARAVAPSTPELDPAQAALDWLGGQVKGRVGNVVGGAVGHAIGGIPGMVAGAAAGELAQNALHALGQRAGVFRAVQGFSKTARGGIRGGIRNVLRSRADTAITGLEGAGTGLRMFAPSAAQVTAQNYDATREHIDRMATDPAYFGDVMGQSFGNLSQAAPEVFSAISQQTAKAVSYLSAVAPGGKSGGPFGESFPVSEDELWEFQQRLAAITDPEFLPSEMRKGALSSQAIESFAVMYPLQYQNLQVETFTRLRELQQMGVPVPINAREQLDVWLDIDGGGDPALSWQVAFRAEAAKKRQQQLGKLGGRPNDEHASAMTSGALSTLNNGASAIAQTG